MRTRAVIAASTSSLLVLSLFLVPMPAQAQDAWLGRDKALHFGASALIAGTSYGVTTAFDERRSVAFAVGGGLGIAAGIGKEAIDALGYGQPSWKDLTWDVIGVVVGLAVAYGVDLLVRPAPAAREARTSALESLGARTTLRF